MIQIRIKMPAGPADTSAVNLTAVDSHFGPAATGATSSAATAASTETDPTWQLIDVNIMLTIVYLSILIIGVVGNICNCLVIADSRNRYMKTATNYYLFSLSVSDLLLLIFGLPHDIVNLWHPSPYLFNQFVCISRGWISEASTYASVLVIVAFTVERYLAICHPLKAHTLSRLSRSVKIIVLIWMVASSCALIVVMQYGVIEVIERKPNGQEVAAAQCTTIHRNETIFELSVLIFFIIPMTVITILYVKLGCQLRQKTKLVIRQSQIKSYHHNNDHQLMDTTTADRATASTSHNQINSISLQQANNNKRYVDNSHHHQTSLAGACLENEFKSHRVELSMDITRNSGLKRRRSWLLFSTLGGFVGARLCFRSSDDTDGEAQMSCCYEIATGTSVSDLNTEISYLGATAAGCCCRSVPDIAHHEQQPPTTIMTRSQPHDNNNQTSFVSPAATARTSNDSNFMPSKCCNVNPECPPTSIAPASSAALAVIASDHRNNNSQMVEFAIAELSTNNAQLNSSGTNRTSSGNSSFENFTTVVSSSKTSKRQQAEGVSKPERAGHVVLQVDENDGKLLLRDSSQQQQRPLQLATVTASDSCGAGRVDTCILPAAMAVVPLSLSARLAATDIATTTAAPTTASLTGRQLASEAMPDGNAMQSSLDANCDRNNISGSNRGRVEPDAANSNELAATSAAASCLPCAAAVAAASIVAHLDQRRQQQLANYSLRLDGEESGGVGGNINSQCQLAKDDNAIDNKCFCGNNDREEAEEQSRGNNSDDDVLDGDTLVDSCQPPTNGDDNNKHDKHNKGINKDNKDEDDENGGRKEEGNASRFELGLKTTKARVKTKLTAGPKKQLPQQQHGQSVLEEPQFSEQESNFTTNNDNYNYNYCASSVIVRFFKCKNVHNPINGNNDDSDSGDKNGSAATTTAANQRATRSSRNSSSTGTSASFTSLQQHKASNRASYKGSMLSALRPQQTAPAITIEQPQQQAQMAPIALNSTGNTANVQSVIKMLVSVVVMFFICWAPFHAQRLMAVYVTEPTIEQEFIYNLLNHVSGISYYISAIVNPILYSLFSVKFRQAFRDTFGSLEICSLKTRASAGFGS